MEAISKERLVKLRDNCDKDYMINLKSSYNR